MQDVHVLHGDAAELLPNLEPDSIDSIVTDPPYGLGFMGLGWDRDTPQAPLWEMALRTAKPGAHLLCFGGTRTIHRTAIAIEDAGWEIRDMLAWLYTSGFPKSHDVSKGIDRAAGATREVIGTAPGARNGNGENVAFGSYGSAASGEYQVTAPATELARQWSGWGTALKPAMEPIILARKPLTGTIASNVAEHGTGGLNIDACRIGDGGGTKCNNRSPDGRCLGHGAGHGRYGGTIHGPETAGGGRWPANVLHDGSLHEVLGMLGAEARCFWSPKVQERERRGSRHPTAKPLALIRYLVRLVTPPGGTVLDPFAGSGTTGEAALAEGCSAILIELEREHVDHTKHRLHGAQLGLGLKER